MEFKRQLVVGIYFNGNFLAILKLVDLIATGCSGQDFGINSVMFAPPFEVSIVWCGMSEFILFTFISIHKLFTVKTGWIQSEFDNKIESCLNST